MRVFTCSGSSNKKQDRISLEENYALLKNKTKQIHPTPVRTATKKNTATTEIANIGEGLEKALPWRTVGGGCEMVRLLWKTVWSILRNEK